MVRFDWMFLLLASCGTSPSRPAHDQPLSGPSKAVALRFVDHARAAIEANRLVVSLAAINEQIDRAYVPPPPVDPRKRLAELQEQRRQLLERIRVVRGNREVMLKTPRGPGAVQISRACLVNPLAKDCD